MYCFSINFDTHTTEKHLDLDLILNLERGLCPGVGVFRRYDNDIIMVIQLKMNCSCYYQIKAATNFGPRQETPCRLRNYF